MTVQVIPVRTTEPVQTEWTDSTAAVCQDLTGRVVKKVTVYSHALHQRIIFLLIRQSVNKEESTQLESDITCLFFSQCEIGDSST